MKSNHTGVAAITAFFMLIVCSTISAKEYKIILIHGLQVNQLVDSSGSNVVSDGEQAWSNFWGSKADIRIDWPAYERIEGKIATDWVWPKLKQISRSNLCSQGCVLVSHSTGDLVARYLLDNQANWLSNAGLTPLNIVATFDFAGAGGGSELADLAVTKFTAASNWNYWVDLALQLWLGASVQDALGVLHDLKPNNARKIAALPSSSVPRLRFVGNSDSFFNLTDWFLPGNDDGVVASHSTCGASTKGAFGSCSRNINMNGHVATQHNAVQSFMAYHYPMIMSNNDTHTSVIQGVHKGQATVANSRYNVDGNTIKYSTKEVTSGFWIWKKKYRYILRSDSLSSSELVYNSMP